MGKSPAVITANMVMAPAARLKLLRNFARNKNNTADINVPECAIPTQNTKLVIYTPQNAGCRSPVTPNPKNIWYPHTSIPNIKQMTETVRCYRFLSLFFIFAGGNLNVSEGRSYPLCISGNIIHIKIPLTVEFYRDFVYIINMENQELTDKEETKQGNYDSAWKEVIELHLEDFLKFFFPKVHREIDFSKGYESLNQELRSITPKSKTGKRLADVLVKVHLKGKKKTACIVIFIHIEIQGSRETGFERRVFIYFYRIFDLKIARDAEIISLMILTDEDKNYRPDKFVIDRMGFNLRMKVPMVKIIDYKNKPGLKTKLEKSKSPMALVVKAQLKSIEAKKKDNNAKAFIKRELVYQLFRSGYKKEVIGTLLKFLDYIFSLPEELEEQLKQEIIILEEENKMAYVTSWERIARKEGKKDGIEEGKKEGKKEGRKEGLLEAALEFIKNGVGLDIIARSTGLSMAKLEELAQNAEITVH